MKTLDVSQQIIGYDQKPVPQGGTQIVDEHGKALATVQVVANEKAAERLQSFTDGAGLKLKLDTTPITLKLILLVYLRQAGQMVDAAGSVFNETDQALLHEIALKIAGNSTLELGDTEFDLLKRLADSGKVKPAQGDAMPLYGNEIRMEVRRLVRAAPEKG